MKRWHGIGHYQEPIEKNWESIGHTFSCFLLSNSVPFVVTAAVFDPANFTIQEVKDHVEALPNNAARTPEIQRILDLERAHKNRTTLVTWLDEQTGVV